VDVVGADRGVAEPILVPAKRVLAERLTVGGPLYRRPKRRGLLEWPELRGQPAFVPLALTELAVERDALQRLQPLGRRPALHERVPHVEQHRTERRGHVRGRST